MSRRKQSKPRQIKRKENNKFTLIFIKGGSLRTYCIYFDRWNRFVTFSSDQNNISTNDMPNYYKNAIRLCDYVYNNVMEMCILFSL